VAKDAAIHQPQSHRTIGFAFVSAHAPQPIAGSVATRHFSQSKEKTQPFVIAQHAQIFQRPSSARKYENTRHDMSRRAIPRSAAGAGQFMVDKAANAHRSQIFAKQRRPTVRRQ